MTRRFLQGWPRGLPAPVGLSMVLPMVLIAAVVALGGCSTSKEPRSGLEIVDPQSGVDYTVALRGVDDEDLRDLVEKSLKLYTLAHRKPASKARLRRRAESDMETIVAVLRSEGYYLGGASFAMAAVPPSASAPVVAAGADERAAPAPVAADTAGATAEGPYSVTISVESGPRFTLAAMTIEPAVTAQGLEVASSKSLGTTVGSSARAAEIVEVEARAVAWLTERGYPYARFEGRTVTADVEKHTLSVVSRVAPGPRVRFGAMRFEGLKSVQARYLQSYTPWQEHALYSRSAIERFQTSLFATNLFDSVSVQPMTLAEATMAAANKGETAPGEATRKRAEEDAQAVPVPITVTATEAKHRSVGAGARYSTDDGPEATAFFEHRNLFGGNETARATVIGGLHRQELSLGIRKPQFLLKPNALFGSLVVRHEDDEAFEERAVTLLVGLENQWNRRLTLSGGLSLELSQIDDDLDGDFDVAQLVGAPLSARYDASNSLFDPTRGYRLGASVTPYVGSYLNSTLLFTSADIGGSVYVPLDEAQRYVFAARGRVGTLLGAERDALPATKRLYSGGGGSVRGYESRFIGPLDVRGDPVGGRSVLEAGVEMRIRIGENLGVVPFVDAGTVSKAIFPDFSENVQIAAGLGVRYYTIIGPIRADIAVPVNPREEDSAFQFYISIGQAF